MFIVFVESLLKLLLWESQLYMNCLVLLNGCCFLTLFHGCFVQMDRVSLKRRRSVVPKQVPKIPDRTDEFGCQFRQELPRPGSSGACRIIPEGELFISCV